MQIEDNITQEYRAGATKVPEPAVPPKKANAKAPSAGKSKPVLNSDEMAEALMYRCMDYIQTEMNRLAEKVAEVTRPWFLCFLVCLKFEKNACFHIYFSGFYCRNCLRK